MELLVICNFDLRNFLLHFEDLLMNHFMVETVILVLQAYLLQILKLVIWLINDMHHKLFLKSPGNTVKYLDHILTFFNNYVAILEIDSAEVINRLE